MFEKAYYFLNISFIHKLLNFFFGQKINEIKLIFRFFHDVRRYDFEPG